MISRKEVQLELQNLTTEGLDIFGRKEAFEPIRPSFTSFGEVPRSELAQYQGTSESILPRSGEEIISATGQLHPLIRPLLSKMTPSVSGIPIVEEPKVSEFGPETFSVESGVKAPHASPIETTTEEMVKVDMTVLSPEDGNRVLFIYPPNILDEAVIACYRYAVESSIIRPKNPVTIIWTEKLTDENNVVESQPQQEYTPSEGLSWKEHVFKVSASNFNEAVHELRERSPSIHKLIEQTDILSRKFYVKLQTRGGLKWMIQQELQQGPNGVEYDLVVMPCFGKKDSDKELEHFILTHSPVPVVLVRLQENSSSMVPSL